MLKWQDFNYAEPQPCEYEAGSTSDIHGPDDRSYKFSQWFTLWNIMLGAASGKKTTKKTTIQPKPTKSTYLDELQRCGWGKGEYVAAHMWIATQCCSGLTWERGELAHLGRDGYLDKSFEIAPRSFRKKARMVKQLHMVLFTKKTGNITH